MEMEIALTQGKEEELFGDLRPLILIDTESTCNTFMSPNMLEDIRAAKLKLSMGTNAGMKKITVDGRLPGWGRVWFDSGGMANCRIFKNYELE